MTRKKYLKECFIRHFKLTEEDENSHYFIPRTSNNLTSLELYKRSIIHKKCYALASDSRDCISAFRQEYDKFIRQLQDTRKSVRRQAYAYISFTPMRDIFSHKRKRSKAPEQGQASQGSGSPGSVDTQDSVTTRQMSIFKHLLSRIDYLVSEFQDSVERYCDEHLKTSYEILFNGMMSEYEMLINKEIIFPHIEKPLGELIQDDRVKSIMENRYQDETLQVINEIEELHDRISKLMTSSKKFQSSLTKKLKI